MFYMLHELLYIVLMKEYYVKNLNPTPCQLLIFSNCGPPNFSWQRATPIAVGWFAGSTWNNNSRCAIYL